ncbi:transcription termination factor MTERF4, chloroplastic-like [Triticum dicoccoides]|nr:transcription termination factor MTERF4, chloroplastic-like [Triticum dicoccoides]
MLRLHRGVLAQVLSSLSASPVSPLHRLISAAAPAISPNPSFSVEEYLVSTCGLTRPQALKASPKLSHLKSPDKPDAVLAFLAGIGLSTADVAAVVAKDPQLLCAGVESILAPNVAALAGVGLSRSDIARLFSLGRSQFRSRAMASTLHYYLHLFGSLENLLRALKYGSLLSSDIEGVVKPNVAFLQECGLATCDIAKLCISWRYLLQTNPDRLREMVACAEGLGVPRGSPMFRHALRAVAFLSEEKLTTKLEHLKKMFRLSDAEVGIVISKAPAVLLKTKESLQRRSEFLMSEVGLEPTYIAYRPAMLMYSLEGRIRPRYYVVKFLKQNGLIDHDRDFFNTVMVSEKVFMERFICPHKKAAPHLAEDYATACRGEVPARFSFT